MNEFEKLIFNIKQEIESYVDDVNESEYDRGVSDGRSELEGDYDRGYDAGYEEAQEESEPSESEMLKFTLSKLDEMNIRGISLEQLRIELESELATHMPILGYTPSRQLKIV